MTMSSNLPLNTNQLPVSLDVNPNENSFQDILLLYLRRVANAVNTKESGLFLLQENANFEQWYQLGNPQQNRNAYRITVDLVALNGGTAIPTGVTNFVLTSSTQPQAITGYLYPVQGFGGALDSNGVSYFLNDPYIFIRFTGSTNTITINNNSTLTLPWCVWVMEYLKN
jgi:hypothetical protein